MEQSNRPVSYTHLDVYKRQGFMSAESYFVLAVAGTAVFMDFLKIGRAHV